MVFIIPREWWGARPARATFKIKTPTPELWLHHAAGAMLPGDDQVSPIDYQRIRAIQNFHMDKRGWNDIAYSWLVDTDGYIFEGRGPGIAGGHTAGHNTVSHAICVMGNYDIQTPDPDLLPRVAELVRYTHSQGWTPKVFTGGHRDVGATSCPGNKLYPLLPELNRLILEDDVALTPAEQEALTTLVGMLASRSDDAPPWGTANWTAYNEEIWSGPPTSDPGPLNPVTHLQLSKVAGFIRDEISRLGKIVDALESGSGLSEEQVKEIIAGTRLEP